MSTTTRMLDESRRLITSGESPLYGLPMSIATGTMIIFLWLANVHPIENINTSNRAEYGDSTVSSTVRGQRNVTAHDKSSDTDRITIYMTDSDKSASQLAAEDFCGNQGLDVEQIGKITKAQQDEQNISVENFTAYQASMTCKSTKGMTPKQKVVFFAPSR